MSFDDGQQRVSARGDRLGKVALLVVSGESSSRLVMPMTPFIGVRISWLIIARKALLAWAARSAASLASLSSSAERFWSVVDEVATS